MEVEKFVTEELDKIKDNQLYKEFNFNYAFPKNIIPNALLFVGLNPSEDSNNDKSLVSPMELDTFGINFKLQKSL